MHVQPSLADVEEAISTYGDLLYRICLLMLGNEKDAEDVVQETFLQYCKKNPGFPNAEQQKAWLIYVAKNKCKDQLRFRQRHPQVDLDSMDALASEDQEDSGILEAVLDLPEKFRLVLLLYYVEDMRIETIAKSIGRTTSAVKMRLRKGRKLLEERYRKEYL